MIRNGLMFLVFIVGAAGSPVFEPTRPFDDFGDIKCEDEMARLDNFAIQLQNDPQSKGAIMVYAGRMAGDKWPRRGETEARAARIKSYLVKKRGTPTDQVIFINAGYDEYFRVQLWIVPPGAALPRRESAAPKEFHFRKGKPNLRDFRCRV